jgi:hypothetical protein
MQSASSAMRAHRFTHKLSLALALLVGARLLPDATGVVRKQKKKTNLK